MFLFLQLSGRYCINNCQSNTTCEKAAQLLKGHKQMSFTVAVEIRIHCLLEDSGEHTVADTVKKLKIQQRSIGRNTISCKR